ncbi:hypothetical protein [Kitasatospora sp. NBC_00315]|uniref:hypothetical protein n=1 Tax=Kitasatospora sp. NBC_00315 TaxID=2975963 RepID=UPI0032444C72
MPAVHRTAQSGAPPRVRQPSGRGTATVRAPRAADDIAGAHRAHANAYITKSSDPDALTLAVRAIDSFFLRTVTPG